jgi:Na+:H+ antiporter, NhaA family
LRRSDTNGRRIAFRRPNRAERRLLSSILRQETVGGGILLAATAIALIVANSSWGPGYIRAIRTEVGPTTPAWLHLHLPVQAWAGDGLLAIFFFVAGCELKRELVVGQLRDRRAATVPVVAALAGMAIPAVIYLALAGADSAARPGWAVPTATDLAFALAVLAITGSALPAALRAFLLTLAVVDDFGAIILIAVFYSRELAVLPLLGGSAIIGSYALLQRRGISGRWLFAGLALTAWTLIHASGVHPTVAAVALGLATRVTPRAPERSGPAWRWEHRLRPLSAGVAVPAFALTSVAIAITGNPFTDRAAVSVLLARVIGKTIGVFGGAYLVVRLTSARLAPELRWPDIFAVAVLCGVGFSVSLLISDVAFGIGNPRGEQVKTAVLLSAVVSATLAAALLRIRNRRHKRVTVGG